LVLTVTPKPTKVSTQLQSVLSETYTWDVNETTYTLAGYLVTNDGCTADKYGIDCNSKPTVSTQLQSVLGNFYTWILMKLLMLGTCLLKTDVLQTKIGRTVTLNQLNIYSSYNLFWRNL
jgi:hypothetical protein